MRTVIVLAGAAGSLLAAGCGAGGPAVLLETDFETDPVAEGWELGGPPGAAPPDGDWVGDAGARHLEVRRGWWQGPPLPVEPLEYFRVRFRSRADEPAYWAAVFLDGGGAELAADAYDGLRPGDAWQEHVGCLRAPPGAAWMRVRFQALTRPVAVDDVRAEAVGLDEVSEWCDATYAAIPPVGFEPPAGRGRHLARTARLLTGGGRLRIVVLGDSIANDLSNSLFEAALARRFPRARVEVLASVRSGSGCEFYRQEGRVGPYVLAHEPDLVVIAGISHGFDAEAMRDVVRQVRAGSGAEVLVLSGAVSPPERMRRHMLEHSGLPAPVVDEVIRRWPERLAQMADEEEVEFFDLRAAWEAYLAASPQPLTWYLRDAIHANARGKQAMGRMVARYLEPPG